MSWWRVTVTSEQTIVVGTGATRAFHTPSLGYIPGSTLRGAPPPGGSGTATRIPSSRKPSTIRCGSGPCWP